MGSDPDPVQAILTSIRSWRLEELADFAEKRHGFENSDGGFGVIYPADVDDCEGEIEGAAILEGCVRVYGYWGPPDGYELDVSERLYLDTLAAELDRAGQPADAERVRAMPAG